MTDGADELARHAGRNERTGARVVVAGLIHESNAFAGGTTELDDFVRLGADRLARIRADAGTEFSGAIAELRDCAATAVPTSLAWAQSSGPVTASAAQQLLDDLAAGLRDASEHGAVDAVVLCLHGSMCSVVDDDLDGAALAAVRDVVGADVPIVATLDWHASVTDRMVDTADALIGYRTYPHIDQEARGRDAAALALRLSTGEVAGHPSWRHPPMLLAGPLTRHDAAAMRDGLERGEELGADPEVLTWSVLPGFARSDNASTGCHVYALATEPTVADRVTAELAELLWERREQFVAVTEPATPDVLRPRGGQGPIVLSDQGDNPGGGAAGDGATLLALLDEHGPPGSVVASLYDPAAVECCVDAGVGAEVFLDLGGHTDGLHGPTWTTSVTVEALADGDYVMQSPTHPNVPVRIGPVALVRTAAGTVVVLTSSRVQNEDLELLTHVGIDPHSVPVIAVKSNAHFRAAFEPIASHVVDVDTPGLSTPHLERLPYRHVPRPIFPLDPDIDWSPT